MTDKGPSQEIELFDDFPGARPPKMRFRKKFWPQQKLTFVLPYEKAVFGLLALTMALIVTFALGMERGRRIYGYVVREPGPKVEATALASAAAPAVESKVEKNVEKLISRDFFTIQVATFTRSDLAQLEKERLTKQGFEVSLNKADKYIQICIGRFKTRKEAEDQLKRLKSIYKDSYIRLRRD